MEPQEALRGDGFTCDWVYFMDPEGMLFEWQEKKLNIQIGGNSDGNYGY